jgi:tol-pal system protein YbgF
MKTKAANGALSAMLRGAAVLPAVFLLLLSSCISDLSAIKEMQTDINDLKQSSFETKKQLGDLSGKVAALKGGGASGESVEALRKSQQNLYLQVQDATREVQLLSGRFDENKYYMDRYFKNTTAELDMIKARVNNLSASGGDAEALAAIRTRLDAIEAEVAALKKRIPAAEAATAPQKATETAPAAKPSAKEADTPQKAYDAAYDAFKEGRYAEAREKMKAFLKKYPSDRLAGNAQFWLAETYFAEDDFDDAILAYEEVLQNYGDSQKVPAAMLKQAYAFRELGDRKAARGILKQLVARFPGSEQAKAAEKELQKLSGTSGKQ